ncbi:ribosomal protection-like ABC-F family protein [Echinicola shivajiensis]|uniref:ribosomal protection-like ABC-F family protein n=1 Tax=Echinicola shivajiensis TaxID=1035916 RepID=UPI001BFC79DC|nr:ABC-F family ATP-binding cassette domain-containing protein [Echinicola shivajiensis]
MLNIHNLSYRHLNKEILFQGITLSILPQDKIALVGNNGTGKSTLLKIIAGQFSPEKGEVNLAQRPYYVPQIFGQYNHLTVAEALNISHKIDALHKILEGDPSMENYEMLNDDWTIEERCLSSLAHWGLADLNLTQMMHTLSGGQKTKIFLAGIDIHEPDLILLDEPTNHLDIVGRSLIYDFIKSTKYTLLVVSHDRKLLNLLNTVCELTPQGIKAYGGNYDEYTKQKQVELNALHQDIQGLEKTLKKAKDKERETIQRQQKQDARGKVKQTKAGMGKAMMDKMKNDAQNSSSKIAGVHAEKIDGISKELCSLRNTMPDLDKMKFGLDHSVLHKGKILFEAKEINFRYEQNYLWKNNLSFQLLSGERVSLKGENGSGKTTLIKLLLGELEPDLGMLSSFVSGNAVYIDQDYSLIDNNLKVHEQAQSVNTSGLQEHEVKTRLNRFLFPQKDWDKPCMVLSGGERMRLMLCCLTINSQAPDLIILDEPTNNLDVQSLEILTAAINEYQGTLIVVSHDETFLDEVHINKTLLLNN